MKLFSYQFANSSNVCCCFVFCFFIKGNSTYVIITSVFVCSVQDIRGLDKEMRAWDAFTGLDSMVKNMMTSLRAVGELQNPAIRDRHWQQLMEATQVSPAGY